MRPAMKLVLLGANGTQTCCASPSPHRSVHHHAANHPWRGLSLCRDVDWGDGSELETGDSMSHAYAAAGTYTVTLRLPRADRWLASISMDSDHVVGDALAALRGCRALTYIRLHTNAGLNSAHSLATLRGWWPSMTYLHLGNTQSLITGALADLPASMAILRLRQHAVAHHRHAGRPRPWQPVPASTQSLIGHVGRPRRR